MSFIDNMVRAMKIEMTRQAEENGDWVAERGGPSQKFSFGVDGYFDMEKVARAALEAMVPQEGHAYTYTGDRGWIVIQRVGRADAHP